MTQPLTSKQSCTTCGEPHYDGVYYNHNFAGPEQPSSKTKVATTAEPHPDTARLDWLTSQVVDTIYLDGHRIIDVGGHRERPHDLRFILDEVRAETKVATQHEETGRMWGGPRDQIPKGYSAVEATECQHDLLKPGTTIEVIDKWKAKCVACIEFFDLPGQPDEKPDCHCGHPFAPNHQTPGTECSVEDCLCGCYRAAPETTTSHGSDPRCSDCPPAGYPTDETRCAACPLRVL